MDKWEKDEMERIFFLSVSPFIHLSFSPVFRF